MKSLLILLLLTTNVVSGQSYGDLKASYDEKVTFIKLLNQRIEQLQLQIKLTSERDADKISTLSTALNEANRQTGLVTDNLATVEENLVSCTTERDQLAADLKKYRPRTQAGRLLRKARNGLAVVGGLALVGVGLNLILP